MARGHGCQPRRTLSALREAAPHLRAADAATIINISSGVGLSPFADRAAFATSKGGLITLGKVLAIELAPRIRVNTICPG